MLPATICEESLAVPRPAAYVSLFVLRLTVDPARRGGAGRQMRRGDWEIHKLRKIILFKLLRFYDNMNYEYDTMNS